MSVPMIPIPAAAELSQLISLINQNFANLASSSITEVRNDRSGMPRILIGIAPDGEIDIGITKTGFDITKQYS